MLQLLSYRLKGLFVAVVHPRDGLIHDLRYLPERHLAPYSQQYDLSQVGRQRLQQFLNQFGVDQVVLPGLEPEPLRVSRLSRCLSPESQTPCPADGTISHHPKQPRSDVVGTLSLPQQPDESILDDVLGLLIGVPLTGVQHQLRPVRLVPLS